MKKGETMGVEILNVLNEIIKDRKTNPSEDSYTCRLFLGGDNKIIKKLGEENAEFIKAFLTQSKREIAEEAADYIYHLIVALRHKDVDFGAVIEELDRRHAVQSRSEDGK